MPWLYRRRRCFVDGRVSCQIGTNEAGRRVEEVRWDNRDMVRVTSTASCDRGRSWWCWCDFVIVRIAFWRRWRYSLRRARRSAECITEYSVSCEPDGDKTNGPLCKFAEPAVASTIRRARWLKGTVAVFIGCIAIRGTQSICIEVKASAAQGRTARWDWRRRARALDCRLCFWLKRYCRQWRWRC